MSVLVQNVKTWLTTTHDTYDGVHTISGRNWDQKCQALVVQVCRKFGRVGKYYESANLARAASKIYTRDENRAHIGDIGYWAIGTYGHVALYLGGGRFLMASRHVTTHWGNPAHNVGTIDKDEYARLSGAVFVGFAKTNGVNSVKLKTNAMVQAEKAAEQQKVDDAKKAKAEHDRKVAADKLAAEKKAADEKRAEAAAAEQAKKDAAAKIKHAKDYHIALLAIQHTQGLYKEDDAPEVYALISGNQALHLTPAAYARMRDELHIDITHLPAGTLATLGIKKVQAGN